MPARDNPDAHHHERASNRERSREPVGEVLPHVHSANPLASRSRL